MNNQFKYEIIKQKVFKIGVQTLYKREDNTYWIEIRNRTYYSFHEVKLEKLEKWKSELSN